MEQSTILESFETSLPVNICVERYSIVVFLIVAIIAIYVQISLTVFFEVLLGIFLLAGIVALGFVAMAAHIRYYFHFEKNRKVELYTDKMIIRVNNEVVAEIFKNNIAKIILHDRFRSGSFNAFTTLADSFYYLVVIDNSHETFTLTCLLDIRLKKKIAAWYGLELEHKYQFFPLPSL